MATTDLITAFGGQSERVCVPAGMVLPMPEKLSFSEAASIPVVWLTAWHMLHALANLKQGQTVLIHSAAGGVGTAAVQICRRAGAKTIGTASAPKHARLRELGLDHAIDYRTQDFEPEVMRLTSGRVTRIGWARVDDRGAFYFAHSYAAETPAAIAHSEGVVAAADRGSFLGVQFHPEKSGAAGARFLAECLSRA